MPEGECLTKKLDCYCSWQAEAATSSTAPGAQSTGEQPDWWGCQTVVPSHWREDSHSSVRRVSNSGALSLTGGFTLLGAWSAHGTTAPSSVLFWRIHCYSSPRCLCMGRLSLYKECRVPRLKDSGSPTNTSLLLSALGMPSLCSCCPGWSLCFSLPVCSSSCLVYTAFLCSSVLHHSFVFKMVLYGCRFLIHVTFRK